jgi:propanediol dehydratase large subunit
MRSYLCVPITGTSVLSLLVGFSEAMILVRCRCLTVLKGLEVSGMRLAVCGTIGLSANIQSALAEECLLRSEVGHESTAGVPRRRLGTDTHMQDLPTVQTLGNLG